MVSTRDVGINDQGLRIGQYHQHAKLTDADVDRLLELREQGWSYARLAAKFDICKTHAWKICNGQKRGQLVKAFRTVPLANARK
jgi:hypothetical protein